MRFLHSIVAGCMCFLLVGSMPASAQDRELPLGSTLPLTGQTVDDVTGDAVTIGSLTGERGTVFIFWSNQCAWVSQYEDRVLALAREFRGQGINVVLVNANDPEAFPGEATDAARWQDRPVRYVVDPGGRFARALGATRTPHVFVFDADDTLVYLGTIDDSPGDPGNVGKEYLRDALAALIAGEAIPVTETKAFGCTIKFPR